MSTEEMSSRDPQIHTRDFTRSQEAEILNYVEGRKEGPEKFGLTLIVTLLISMVC